MNKNKDKLKIIGAIVQAELTAISSQVCLAVGAVVVNIHAIVNATGNQAASAPSSVEKDIQSRDNDAY